MAHGRGVLHVLPHPGGGGETYIDAIEGIDGYRFDRAYLAPSARSPGPRRTILRAAARVARSARAYDVVHAHGEVASTLCLPTLATRPSVSTLHGLHLLRRLDGVGAAAARANVRLISSAATRTICVSQAEYDEIAGFLGSRGLARTVVIRNGVEPLEPATGGARAVVRDELGLDPSSVVGAWIGSLDEHKDPLTPMAAVSTLARSGLPVELFVAGDGPLRAAVDRAADASPALHVLGFRRDVQHVLGAADFFVLSSLREGLSFALLEAMTLGLVPVVSDAPGNPEAVGDAGIVVPFGDEARFAEAIAELAGDEPARRNRGGLARERVLEQFHADEMRRRTQALYDAVAAER